MVYIKDLVDSVMLRMGKDLVFESPKEKLKKLKTEFGYKGYCYRYPEGNYNFHRYNSLDYNKALIDAALRAGKTYGILKTLTSLLQLVKDEGTENAELDFLKNGLDSKLKKYNDMEDLYGQVAEEVITNLSKSK